MLLRFKFSNIQLIGSDHFLFLVIFTSYYYLFCIFFSVGTNFILGWVGDNAGGNPCRKLIGFYSLKIHQTLIPSILYTVYEEKHDDVVESITYICTYFRIWRGRGIIIFAVVLIVYYFFFTFFNYLSSIDILGPLALVVNLLSLNVHFPVPMWNNNANNRHRVQIIIIIFYHACINIYYHHNVLNISSSSCVFYS